MTVFRDDAAARRTRHIPTVGGEYGYRFVEPCGTGAVWRVERFGSWFLARRCMLADPGTQALLRLRHPHVPGVVDMIEDGDAFWLVSPWCTQIAVTQLTGECARVAALALISVWCGLRDLGLIAFPEQPQFGARPDGGLVVLSLGPVRRAAPVPVGVAGGAVDDVVGHSGRLALATYVAQLLRLDPCGPAVAAVLDGWTHSDKRDQMGASLVRAWHGHGVVDEAAFVTLGTKQGGVLDDAPDRGRADNDEHRGLLRAAIWLIRGRLGALDDIAAAVDTRVRKRAAVRAATQRRRAGRVSPALVSVALTATLVAVALVVLRT